MSDETKTGTIKDTTQFKDFHEYVKGKFGNMGNFSMHHYGMRNKLCSLQNKLDTQKTRDYIWELSRLAQQLTYDESKVYISKAEIDNIVKRVNDKAEINNTSVNKWLIAEKFNTSTYSSIINGLNIYKNKSYEKLIKILEI